MSEPDALPGVLPPWLEAILIRARDYERKHGPAWTWSDVQAAPSHLVQLVTFGRAKIVGQKDRRFTYALTEAGYHSETGVQSTSLPKDRGTGNPPEELDAGGGPP